MTHVWVRAESRPNEKRVAIMPDGVRQLISEGLQVTVEDSPSRIVPAEDFARAGARIVAEGSWPSAPEDAFVLGLKELPEDGTPLRHRHIMFGHAFKGQPAGQVLLDRFRAGGGALYDLEYLLDDSGRRLAAFGYWAGYVGAALALRCWAAQQQGGICGPVEAWDDRRVLAEDLRARLDATGKPRPRAIVIGARGRVGQGAVDLMTETGSPVTAWDVDETAHGGPFPEILRHDIFINAILARPGTPVFVPASAVAAERGLTVIGDVACDPTSDFSPIKVYDRTTSWERPALRVAEAPPLDVMAIDNLPSLLPRESSEDFSAQLLPLLVGLTRIDDDPWARARRIFDAHLARPADRAP